MRYGHGEKCDVSDIREFMVDDGKKKKRTSVQMACYFSHSYPALKAIFTAECNRLWLVAVCVCVCVCFF